MQQVNNLRTISLLVVLALVTFGCATDDGSYAARKNQTANEEFEITAEAVSEGILITLSNLPADTTHLWIQFTSWGNTEEPENSHSIITSYAGITDASVDGWVNSTQNLEKIKQTGKIIFPIVQSGTKYYISAMVHNEHEIIAMRNRENIYPRTANTEFVADNGIYFNREDVNLEIDETHSVVTLSSEPIFPSDVIFYKQKYSFGVRVIANDINGSIGIGDHHFSGGLSSDGRTWTFEPYFTDILRNDDVAIDWLGIGIFHSAYANVYANIIYDDIRWSVEIAKTPEFNFSL